MDNQEMDMKGYNDGIDQFIKEAFKEEVKISKETNKKKKYRKHFELIIISNSTSNQWEVILNSQIIGSYETKEEAEDAAERMNFVYNIGLIEGILKGKELQERYDEGNLEFGLAMSTFETKDEE